MGLFYKISKKEYVKIRNEIFIKRAIPVLKQNGFVKSPFSNAEFGKHPLGVFYDMCRLSNTSELEMIRVDIIKGYRYIQIYLNVFNLEPKVENIE